MVNSLRPNRYALIADPWLAVNYSLVFPGLGQLYSHYWLKGTALLAIAATLIGYAVWAIFGATGNTIQGFGALGLLSVLYSFSILDAYRGTQPNYATRISIPKGRKDPWYAVFLSQLIPGLGHLYIQQAAMGGLLLAAGLATAWLGNYYSQFALFPPAIWAFSCYHVYISFPHKSRRRSTAIALLVLGLFWVRLVLGGAPSWIDQTFIQCIVPSDSMVPTLQIGDRLFVHQKPDYQPEVGDIVVFRAPAAALELVPPGNPDPLFVKRIIGLPGQELAVTQGKVWVDGHPLQEHYVQAPPNYQWGPENVPSESYFVLGDNRNNSGDSHIWGYVPADHVLGRAYKIYWPPQRIRSLEMD